MSFHAITTFFEEVAEDSSLKQDVQTALDNRAEAAAFEIVDIAMAHGCEFTATELREYLAAQAPDIELSEDQLEAVAGGLLKVRALDLVGLRKIRLLPLDRLAVPRDVDWAPVQDEPTSK